MVGVLGSAIVVPVSYIIGMQLGRLDKIQEYLCCKASVRITGDLNIGDIWAVKRIL